MRAGTLVAGLVVAALLIAVPDTGLFVMWKVIIPTLPLLFLTAPGLWRNLCPLAASNQTPRALKLTKALTAPNWLKEYGYVIAFSLFIAVRRPAPLRPRRQRRLLRAAAARRDGRGLHRRHVPQGQERLVQHDLPAAARSSASTARRRSRWSPTRTASRASAASRTATTSTRAPPTWPTSTTPTSYWSGYRRYFVGAFPGLVLALLRGPGRLQPRDPRRDGALRGGQHRRLRHAQRLLQDEHPHDHEPLRRDRVQHLLLEVAPQVDRRPRGARLRDRAPPRSPSPRPGSCARSARRSRSWTARAPRPAAAAPRPATGRRRRAHPRQRHAHDRGRRAAGHLPPRQQARRAQAGHEPARDRRGQRHADRGRLPDGHLRRRPGRDQGRHELHVADLRRREGHARAPRLRREHPHGVLRARHRPGHRRAHARQAERAAHQQDPRLQLRQGRQARRRGRQRDRGRHRRRSPAPTPPGREDRPDRRGAAPPLQPHGHQPARLRPHAPCRASTSTRTPGTTSARSPPGSNTRALWIDRTNRAGRARHGREARLRPPDPRLRLAQLRPADRGLRRPRHRRPAKRRRRDGPARLRAEGRARAAASSPAAACSASRPPTRCTSSA